MTTCGISVSIRSENMGVIIFTAIAFVSFVVIGLAVVNDETLEDKISIWLGEQGYENIEVKNVGFTRQMLYTKTELFGTAEFFDVTCEKNGVFEKKIIKYKFRNISVYDSNKLFHI